MKKDENKTVTLEGWVIGIRKLSNILFIVLQRSESRTIQVVVKKTKIIEDINKKIKIGHLIKAVGVFSEKIEKKGGYFESGGTELILDNWELINESSKLPFEIKDDIDIKDENRYKYRYIDLRRKKSSYPIITKSKFISHARKILDSKKFIEIDTPILSQYSPEGAKTFIVPSNIEKKFYTLPQSPQIFKQILMMSGFSKYYQIAKNFRNEDSRSNRQPEFLQLDIEFWFANEKKILKITKQILKNFLLKELKVPKEKISFEKISFENCIKKYGSDKPDIRNNLKIENSRIGKFILLKDIKIEKYYDNISYLISNQKNFNVLILKTENGKITLLKIFETKNNTKIDNYETIKKIEKNSKLKENGIYIFLKRTKSNESRQLEILGKIRSLFDSHFTNNFDTYKFLWINNWKMFQKEEENNNFSLIRHPFTMPKKKYLNLINQKYSTETKKLMKVKCEAYDLICNGEEIGSGSLRINESNLQKKIFELIGLNPLEIEKHFGYFLEALKFAAPPHGGIGIGIERIISVFLKLKNLKETIAFPKNIDGTCSLTGAPDSIEIDQN